MSGSIASSPFSGEAPVPTVRRRDAARRTMSARMIGILAMAALAGCTSTTSTGASATGTGAAPTTITQATPAPTLAPTLAPTPTRVAPPTLLAPPAAPTDLKAWSTVENDAVIQHFSWSKPAGQVDGYYLQSVWYVPDEDTIPPLSPCRSDWQKLLPSNTTYQDGLQDGAYQVFLCAFNAAGTSTTVAFPQASAPG